MYIHGIGNDITEDNYFSIIHVDYVIAGGCRESVLCRYRMVISEKERRRREMNKQNENRTKMVKEKKGKEEYRCKFHKYLLPFTFIQC